MMIKLMQYISSKCVTVKLKIRRKYAENTTYQYYNHDND